jgi:hypothetical protein
VNLCCINFLYRALAPFVHGTLLVFYTSERSPPHKNNTVTAVLGCSFELCKSSPRVPPCIPTHMCGFKVFNYIVNHYVDTIIDSTQHPEIYGLPVQTLSVADAPLLSPSRSFLQVGSLCLL